MGDYGSDDGLVGFVTTVGTVISEIAKYDSDSTGRYYDYKNRENELRLMAMRDEYEYDLEEERISAQAALMEQKMADDHEEEIAIIDAARMQAANTHEEEMEKIAVLERLKTQENELKKLRILEETKRFMSLLEVSERAYTKKLEYLQTLAKNAQDYYLPLRDKLLTLIEQSEYSCKAQSCTGKEYDANISRLERLHASLDKCNSDYNQLQYNLELAASNVKIEMLSAPNGGMIENV